MTSTTISDFHFIAHDTHPSQKRHIPTVVRAHVMERYHREKRANSGMQEDGMLALSQQPSSQPFPVKQGHILRWNTKSKLRKTKKREIPRHEDGEKDECGRLETCQASRSQGDKISPTSGNVEPKTVIMDVFASRVPKPVRKNFIYNSHIRSLMPQHELEIGGMRLVRVLDDYYGVLDLQQKNIDPWHEMWIPFAFTDPLLFHACIAKFSFHAAAAAGEPMQDPEVFKHLGSAIQGMSQAIARPDGPFPDLVLVSAICLCGVEMLGPNTSALRAHLHAARRMIEWNGGVAAMKMNPVVMAGYFAYEYIIATIDGDFQVEAPFDDLGLKDPFALLFPSASGVFTLSRKPVDPTSYGFSRDVINLLATLCKELCISDVLKYDGDEEPALEELLHNLYKKHKPKHRSHLEQESRPAGVIEEDHALNALLITISLQFPHLTPLQYAHQSKQLRVTNLLHHLRHSSMHEYWNPIPGALIWCLMVAIPASRDLPERSTFIASLLRTTVGVAFEAIEEIRVTLSTFHRLAREQKEKEQSLYRIDELLGLTSSEW